MSTRPRLYSNILQDHFAKLDKMAFVSGPRQVGKTSVCRSLSDFYLNWDNKEDRRKILDDPSNLAAWVEEKAAQPRLPLLCLDEFHKYAKWKNLLKGFFDTYQHSVHIIATGSSRMDIYRRGSDSLMGRYFPYRMHPFSVGEIARTELPKQMVRPPLNISEEDWNALWQHGGFPEPFTQRDMAITRRWRSLRNEQLTREDLRDITQVQEIGTIEVLMQLLEEHSSQQLIYANYAQQLGVTPQTIKRWVDLLNRLHYGFSVSPWFSNISRALRKEPKWFLRDWSGLTDTGAKAETFVACHLLKAVEGWTDLGLGDFQLRYIRTTNRQEVDFLVVQDKKPWMLVEVKYSDMTFAKNLEVFHKQLKTEYAFQVVIDRPYVAVDCFQYHEPKIVPARTFLSQLL